MCSSETTALIIPIPLLGKECQRLREKAGLSQADVAAKMGPRGPDNTTISKFENGERTLAPHHVRAMLEMYEAGADYVKELVRVAEKARERRWWHAYTLPQWFERFISLESDAQEVWCYQGGYVPGLLQTSEYALATGANRELAQVRARRQRRLYDCRPLLLRAVIDEAVLRRDVVTGQVKREQVAYLRAAAELANVSLRIVPFTAGSHPGLLGSFTVFRFDEKSLNQVYVEKLGRGSFFIKEPREVARQEKSFKEIANRALSDACSASLLTEIEGNGK